jgi:phosphoenolpyruvate synthase/pyruvate phosphate dikinase
MNFILPLDAVSLQHRKVVGGKGYSLAVLRQKGFQVPRTWCITTAAYQNFVSATGVKPRLLMELNRKKFKDLRWEELWDSALRIRSLFASAHIPENVVASLKSALAAELPERCVIRSSAPGEDSRKTSFAGLHASFVNVVGLQSILDHVKLVWASLWSDGALLYRREMRLNVDRSSMAVLVQEMVSGEKSGVAFGQNPQDASQAVVEAVYGLNQGLVDGTVEPDRWLLDRDSGRIISYKAAEKDKVVLPAASGVHFEPLSLGETHASPLSEAEVARVFDLVQASEALFGAPQDMEWTFSGGQLFVLQSRPITTLRQAAKGDQRPWYLSLRRSFGNLKALRHKVEDDLIPAMQAEGNRLAVLDLKTISVGELKEELVRRARIYRHWKDIYWAEFIPLAHGIRLFGIVYNDALKPQDPYEFMDLLGTGGMLSVKRNRRLSAMAALIRENPELLEEVRCQQVTNPALARMIDQFQRDFGDLFCRASSCPQGPGALADLLEEMAKHPPRLEGAASRDMEAMHKRFLSHFTGEKRAEAEDLLDLARASYRLRDDDNLHLGRIQAQLIKAAEELRHRGPAGTKVLRRLPPDVQEMQADFEETSTTIKPEGWQAAVGRMKARQIVGQPAGPGLARGPARVILSPADLFQFKAGDILVCDAVDPNMTFVVPLALAIVERRGGMLIHGSIIAREYGIPCVTGVPNAVTLIHNGDTLTVDGYLGIVTIG